MSNSDRVQSGVKTVAAGACRLRREEHSMGTCHRLVRVAAAHRRQILCGSMSNCARVLLSADDVSAFRDVQVLILDRPPNA